jgi:hypothetical protein
MGGAYFTRDAAKSGRSKPRIIASLPGFARTLTWAGFLAARMCWMGWMCLLSSGCEERFDGPPEIVPAQLSPESALGLAPEPSLVAIRDQDTVSLTRPIQGGHVLFIGAFIRNLSMRGGSLLGELRRSQSGDGMPLMQPGGVLYSDERSVSVQPFPADQPPPGSGAGWKQVAPDPNDMANIPTCPNTLALDIADNPLFLVVRYTDGGGRSASAVRTVTPRCLQPSSEARRACLCECLAGYTVDRCTNISPSDGGTD